jgi:histidine triad (HIT) family protein
VKVATFTPANALNEPFRYGGWFSFYVQRAGIMSAMTKEFNHEPQGYQCPFCLVVAGHVLVIPNEHYENIYDIPQDLLVEVYKVVQKVAIAIRSTYDCEGTSTRQHNEPAGGQDVWHLHVHVFPRHENDQLYQNDDQNNFVDAAARAPYARKLQAYFAEHK